LGESGELAVRVPTRPNPSRHDIPADAFCTEAAQRGGAADDMTTQVVWRSVRARVLSVRARHADAQALAREATSLAADTDDVNMRADTLLDLAAVLRAAGRDAGALPPLRQALDLYKAKGNQVSAARTRALLAGDDRSAEEPGSA